MLTPITTTKSGYIRSATAEKKIDSHCFIERINFQDSEKYYNYRASGQDIREQVHSNQNIKGTEKEEIHHTDVLVTNIDLMVCNSFKVSNYVHLSVCQQGEGG